MRDPCHRRHRRHHCHLRLLATLATLALPVSLRAQQARPLTLREAIQLAQQRGHVARANRATHDAAVNRNLSFNSRLLPQLSAARAQPPFLAQNGQFDQAAWDSHNYPALLDRYFAQSFRVPLYLVSGDNDKFGVAFETAIVTLAVAAV